MIQIYKPTSEKYYKIIFHISSHSNFSRHFKAFQDRRTSIIIFWLMWIGDFEAEETK